MRQSYLIIFISVIIFTITGSSPESFGRAVVPQRPVFSLNVKDKELSQVLEDVSVASGYKIVFNGDDDLKISLTLRNSGLEQTLKRVLRDINYTAVWDDTHKKVFISVFGQKKASGMGRAGISPGISKGVAGMHINPPGMFPRKVPVPGKAVRPGQRQIPGVGISGRNTRFVQTTSTLRQWSKVQ
jgi:hypothetical protein